MHKFSRELEENTIWFRQHPHILNVFRSKIKSKEKRDKLWNVLGEKCHKKTQKHKIDKSKNLSESLCEKSPELASHRMKYICVALQVPKLKGASSQSPIDLRNRTDNIFRCIINTFFIKHYLTASQSQSQ